MCVCGGGGQGKRVCVVEGRGACLCVCVGGACLCVQVGRVHVCVGGVYVMWGDGVLFIFCKCVAIFNKLKYYSRTDLILYLHFMYGFFLQLSFKAYLSLSKRKKSLSFYLKKRTKLTSKRRWNTEGLLQKLFVSTSLIPYNC